MRRAGRLDSGGSTLAEVICQYLSEECGPDKIAASTNGSTRAHLQALVRYFSDAGGRTPPISQDDIFAWRRDAWVDAHLSRGYIGMTLHTWRKLWAFAQRNGHLPAGNAFPSPASQVPWPRLPRRKEPPAKPAGHPPIPALIEAISHLKQSERRLPREAGEVARLSSSPACGPARPSDSHPPRSTCEAAETDRVT